MRASILCKRLYKDAMCRGLPCLSGPAFPVRANRTCAAVLASRSSTRTSAEGNGSGKEEALNAALGEINSKYGKGTVMKLSSQEPLAVEWVSTGALTLDMALGGGIPKGRIVEIYGPESSGKSTLALQAIASSQRQGGTALLIDAEHAFDQDYAKRAGVDVQALLISQPDYGEQALEVCDHFIRSQTIDIVVVDSVAALVPKAEIEGEIGDKHLGGHARMMSQAMRKLSKNASKSDTTIIFINQLRQKIGVIYGNPEVTSGGNALKYFCSIRIDVRRKEILKSAKEDIGIRVKAKIVKNKVAAPFRTADFDIMFASGVNILSSIVDAAEMMGVIKRKGAWYSYNDANLAQGKEKLQEKLRADATLREEIETKTRAAIAENTRPTPIDDDDDDATSSGISNGANSFDNLLQDPALGSGLPAEQEMEAESMPSP